MVQLLWFFDINHKQVKEVTTNMLEDSNLGVKGWASVVPSGSTSSGSSGVAPKSKAKAAKAKAKKVPEKSALLKDHIADYREQELELTRVGEKAAKDPAAWKKVKSYVDAAQEVIENTDAQVGALSGSVQEFLKDFEISTKSPAKFNNFKKSNHFEETVNSLLVVFGTQGANLVKSVITLNRVKDAESESAPLKTKTTNANARCKL